jgi:hypothetical protein
MANCVFDEIKVCPLSTTYVYSGGLPQFCIACSIKGLTHAIRELNKVKQ